MIDLDEVQKLLAGVTPGPWENKYPTRIYASYMCINGLSALFTIARASVPDDAERGYTDDAFNPDTTKANARFIAASRSWVPDMAAEIAALRAEVARLTAERDAAMAGAVTVKPLVWEKADVGAWLGHGVEPCQYYLQLENELWWHPGDDREDAVGFSTIEAAKAAAQADYEARIRAALIPAPDTLRQVREALAAADQFIRNGIELGFIEMPDADTPDPAHKTPGMVSAALALLTKE